MGTEILVLGAVKRAKRTEISIFSSEPEKIARSN
jgi:hypothetical protein